LGIAPFSKITSPKKHYKNISEEHLNKVSDGVQNPKACKGAGSIKE
jgi:hypothetical protein